jgi:hypothetical protein
MWMAANRYKNRSKIAKQKAKKRAKKNAHKEWLIKTFGRTRYYMSWWFGNWILFVGRRHNQPD